MKTKTLFVILVITLSLFSCENEEVNSLNDGLTSRYGSSYKVYYDNGNPDGIWGVDFGCNSSGGNCIEPVVIIRTIELKVNNLAYQVSTGTPSQIREYFQDNTTDLTEFLAIGLIEDVVNEILFVNYRGGIDDSFVLIFADSNDDVQAVQPFIKI